RFCCVIFFSSRRRHTRSKRDWSSDVCSSDLSHFDPTGEQQPFNMRRTIITDDQGRYKFRSILPAGYGCPPDGPTQQLLNQLGRQDRKSTRLNSSHVSISYAVFCLNKKKRN